MKKNYFFATVAMFCFLTLLACSSSQAEVPSATPDSNSMLEEMKSSVTELRIFLMPADYSLNSWDIKNLRKGWQPEWEEDSLGWFSILVANREYDAVIRVPAGDYKIFILALSEWSPVFFSTSDEIITIREGETATPEIRMEPLGIRITVHADGVDPTAIGSAKISFILDGESGTDEVGFWEDWETGDTVSEIFLPYGATNVLLVVNTDKQLVAPISWGDVVDGEIVVNPEPQLAGGILSPEIIFPEE